jgi:hypothetical protein
VSKPVRPLNVLFAALAGLGAFYGAVQLSSRMSSTADAHAAVVEPVLRQAPAPLPDASASAPLRADDKPLSGLGDRSRAIPSPEGDAFGKLSWLPPPPPPPPPVVVVPAPRPPPPPPPPPTLPYKFVGLLDDAQTGKPRVFLSLGEKLLVASPGDVLEGGFRLDSIGAQELAFTHMQQNISLKLSVAGS